METYQWVGVGLIGVGIVLALWGGPTLVSLFGDKVIFTVGNVVGGIAAAVGVSLLFT